MQDVVIINCWSNFFNLVFCFILQVQDVYACLIKENLIIIFNAVAIDKVLIDVCGWVKQMINYRWPF